MKRVLVTLCVLFFCISAFGQYKATDADPVATQQDVAANKMLLNLTYSATNGDDINTVIMSNPQIYTRDAIKGLINKALQANTIMLSRDYLSKAKMVIDCLWSNDKEINELFNSVADYQSIAPQRMLLRRTKLLYISEKLNDGSSFYIDTFIKVMSMNDIVTNDQTSLQKLYSLSMDTLSLILSKYNAVMDDTYISMPVLGGWTLNYEDSLIFNAAKSTKLTAGQKRELMLFRLALLCNNDYVSFGIDKIHLEDFFGSSTDMASFIIGDAPLQGVTMDKITPELFIKYETEKSLESLSRGISTYKTIRALISK